MQKVWVVEVNMKPTRKCIDMWMILAPTDGTSWKHDTEQSALEYVERTRHDGWDYRVRAIPRYDGTETMDSRLEEGRY